MGDTSSTGAPFEALYRAPDNREDTVHEHPVEKVTRKQIKIDRTARDGTLAGSEKDAGEHCYLSRDELEAYGSALHTPTRTRFFEDREAAEASW